MILGNREETSPLCLFTTKLKAMISYHLETLTFKELKDMYSSELIYSKDINTSSPQMNAINESDTATAMKFTNFDFNFN